MEKSLLIENIKDVIRDMYKLVNFDEENHIYTTLDGKWLQGVSTVSSIIPKDWLSAWGAKEAVKALGYSDFEEDTELAEEMLATIQLLRSDEDKTAVEKYIEILKEAKGASRKKSKAALVDGTAGHNHLESYVKAKIRGTELPSIPNGTLERPIKQFIEWAEKEVDYWILSEAKICDVNKGYAGTLDALAMMKNGMLSVVDFKFASHISEDYFLQTAGYQAALEAYGIEIDNRIIVRLPKTLTMQEWDKVNHKYKIVENNIEVKVVDSDYLLDRDTFYHCLPVKSWINLMTKNK